MDIEWLGFLCVSFLFLIDYSRSLSIFSTSLLDIDFGLEYRRTVLYPRRKYARRRALRNDSVQFRHRLFLPYDTARPVAGIDVRFLFSSFLLRA